MPGRRRLEAKLPYPHHRFPPTINQYKCIVQTFSKMVSDTSGGPFTPLLGGRIAELGLRAKGLRGALSRLIPGGESRRSDLRE
jgi:hypothetical protein